jgi:serine/threonine protein kinase
MSGAFGEVRMCVHRETGAQRAVKVLRKSHMDEDEKKMLFNEINILRELVSAFTTLDVCIFPLSFRTPSIFNYDLSESRIFKFN